MDARLLLVCVAVVTAGVVEISPVDPIWDDAPISKNGTIGRLSELVSYNCSNLGLIQVPQNLMENVQVNNTNKQNIIRI